MNIFITGTDTDVGKTIVSSWICLHSNLKYWKPIQTGIDSDKYTVKALSPKTEILEEIYLLNAPLSPYNSAALENKKINTQVFIENIPTNTVIEGAGGVLVPISDNFYVVDLIKIMRVKAIIVAKSRLGFLNHIFLTVSELKSRKIDILGIIITGEVENFLLDTIEKFSGIKILQVIPPMNNLKDELKNLTPSNRFLEILK